jgi:hypothetical protein
MRSLFSGLEGAPTGSGILWGSIDKSKPGDFKPLSLDVIFHGCSAIAAAIELNR